jgi:hypothetical protein
MQMSVPWRRPGGVTDAANLSAGVVKAPEDDILLGQSWKLVTL